MYKSVLSLCAVVALALGLAEPAGASVEPMTVSGNFIHNGNAESAAGSPDGSIVAVPAWTIGSGSTFTAVQYGASGGFPSPTDPGPARRGANFLAGGPDGALTVATQQRIIPVSYRASVDAGTATFALQGFLGGYTSQGDNAKVQVDWLDAGSTVLGSSSIGPVTAQQRSNATGLKARKKTGTVPAGARQVLITLTLTRTDGSYNDGYADNLILKITIPS